MIQWEYESKGICITLQDTNVLCLGVEKMKISPLRLAFFLFFVAPVFFVTAMMIISVLKDVDQAKGAKVAVEEKIELARAERQKKEVEEKREADKVWRIEKERIRRREEGPADALLPANDWRAQPVPLPVIKGHEFFKPFKHQEKVNPPLQRSVYDDDSNRHKAIELDKESKIAKVNSESEIRNWQAETRQKTSSLKVESRILNAKMWRARRSSTKVRTLAKKDAKVVKGMADLNNDLYRRSQLKRIETDAQRAHIRENVRRLNRSSPIRY